MTGIAGFGNNNNYLMNSKTNFRSEKTETKNADKSEEKNVEKTKRKDIYAEMPIRALGYSNELGEAIRPLSPMLANLSWLPAIAYIGADVADKYRQDEYGEQEPSKKRASKQFLTQMLASVFLPTAAVKVGQGIANNAAGFSKSGLTLTHRENISDMVLNSMNEGEHKAFLNAENKVDKAAFKDSLAGKVDEITKHKKTHKGLMKPFYAAIDFIKKPLVREPKAENLKAYTSAVVDRLVDARQQLLDGVKPEKMSEKVFNKFMKHAKDVPMEEKQSLAFDAIRKMEKSKMFNNRIIKSIGGLAALSIMAKPIDKFVEHVVIGKFVGPAIDSINAKPKENTNETKQA